MKKSLLLVLALMLALFAGSALADADYTFDPANPYDGVMSGLFDEVPITTENGDEGTASIYLPEGLQPWTPAVIVLTPDNTTAKDFAQSETGLAWRAVADENLIGLAFLEPASGASWNLTMSEEGRDDAAVLSQLYMTMRSKAVTNVAPFSMDKTHVGLVGYGEGGAAALLFGAQTATEFSAICTVDATAVSAEAMDAAGDMLVLPFPADSTLGVVEMDVQARDVETPVWFINSAEGNEAALGFYIHAADAKEAEANEYAQTVYQGENEAVRIWVSEGETDPATIQSAFLSKTNRFMAMQDGGRVAFTTDFTQPQIVMNEEEINGEPRRWITYVPTTYDPEQETPLVLAIHGYTASAQSTLEESRWHDLAEENGFIVIFPQGLVRESAGMGNIPATCWVAGGFASAFPGADPMVDIDFINTILDKAEEEYNIDTTRIYATGHSNGSMMTWELGVYNTGRFAAIAPIGAMNTPSTAFSGDQLLPTWSFMGEYDGSGMALTEGSDNVATLSAWNEHNGTDESQPVLSNEHDGQWQTITFKNADGVPLVRFTGVLRTAHIYMPEESEAIWDFFSLYSRGEDGTLYYKGEAVTASEYVQSDSWYEPAAE